MLGKINKAIRHFKHIVALENHNTNICSCLDKPQEIFNYLLLTCRATTTPLNFHCKRYAYKGVVTGNSPMLIIKPFSAIRLRTSL